MIKGWNLKTQDEVIIRASGEQVNAITMFEDILFAGMEGNIGEGMELFIPFRYVLLFLSKLQFWSLGIDGFGNFDPKKFFCSFGCYLRFLKRFLSLFIFLLLK